MKFMKGFSNVKNNLSKISKALNTLNNTEVKALIKKAEQASETARMAIQEGADILNSNNEWLCMIEKKRGHRAYKKHAQARSF